MKHSLIHIIILSLAAYVSSCTDERLMPPTAGPEVDGYYFVLAGQNNASRVAYIDENATQFETGDIIGAFAPDNTEEAANVRYAVKAVTQAGALHQVLTPADESTKLSTGLGKYIFYYPYDASTDIERLKSLNFTVNVDQRKDENFEASDILWDVVQPAEGAGNAVIDMDHAMATIVVKIDKDSLDVDKGIDLLNVAINAKGVQLLPSVELDDMINSLNYSTGKQEATIKMHPEKFKSTNQSSMRDMLVYRAVIPAFQTLSKGQEILEAYLYNQDGSMSAKRFKLAGDLNLLPGHNYVFTLRSGVKPPVPEVGDDDSWVLEVTDPSDGELVGYLCREYIYWAPAEYATNYRNAPIDDGNYTFEKTKGNLGRSNNTGYMIRTNPATQDFIDQLNIYGASETLEGVVPAINSQAWVFYNIKNGSVIPDLTKGTILRIIYDINGGGGEPGYSPFLHPKYAYLTQPNDRVGAIWPLPHTSATGTDKFQGIFKVKHGHERINTIALQGGTTGYAYDSPEWLEFYMHGGTITWDPQNNIVDEFFMPSEKITNKIAYENGHISIKTENGVKTASVSYSPMISQTEDEEGNNVGQLIVKNIYVNGVAYPLRKVGFNQFWSGKSLHNTTDNNGKKLECFNTEGEVGDVNYDPWSGEDKPASSDKIKFKSNQKLPAGYIYPTAKKGDTFEGYTYDEDFNPYTTEADRAEIALLYNMTAFTEGKLKPKNTVEESYRFPTWKDMIHLRRYGGVLFAAKWITDQIRTKTADGNYVESTTVALREGMLLGNSAFCANISGLDFRAFGMKWPKDDTNGKVTDFGVRNYFFIDAVNDNPFYTGTGDQWNLEADVMNWVEIFRFSPWDCWGSNPISNYRYDFSAINEAQINRPIAHSRIFAPVRVIMSFNNPIGNGAREAVAAHSRAAYTQPQPRSESRNVYVPLVD